MKMSRRTKRISNSIKYIIAQTILTKLSDPRVDSARTSVTQVEVPEDLLSARVSVSVIGTESQQRRTVEALQNASGFMQDIISSRLRLRHTPVLNFVVDKRLKNAMDTMELIDKAMEEIRDRESSDRLGRPPRDNRQDGE